MQAVILAAGNGTRMMPITLVMPKQLIKVSGEPILAHIIRTLPDIVDEVVVVVGYRAKQIVATFGEEFEGRRMRYVFQEEAHGTADALNQTRELLRGRFLVLNGDDLLDKESITRSIAHEASVLVYEHDKPQSFGVVITNKDGTFASLIEKPQNPPTNLVSTGAFCLPYSIFDHIGERPEDREHYLSEAVARYAKQNPVHIERMNFWQPVGRPEDISRAETLLAFSNPQLRTKKGLARQ